MTPIAIAGWMLALANFWAILRTLRSDAAGRSKLTWVAIVLLLPVVGVLLWMFFGPS